MNILEIINKKKLKKELTEEEIKFAILSYLDKKIPDYQMSALLMAIVCQGFSDQETYFLTKTYVESGKVLDLTQINGLTVDKHSTGGVGDKVTLILGPIIASLGLKFVKMSGRGLGFTGGTIDKLESIDNFKFDLDEKTIFNIINQTGMAVVSQTSDLAPADGVIYSLRDVTETVDYIPLIAASVISKKIAMNTDLILLDVKCGSGAFVKNLKDAKKLGKLMIKIGKKFNKKVIVEITNMNFPLGKAIGNKNEVLEAMEILSNQGSSQLKELIIQSAISILTNLENINKKEAREKVENIFNNKIGLEKFKEWIKSQNGNIEKLLFKDFWKPKYEQKIFADNDGYLKIKDSIVFGNCALELGAGRKTKNEKLDFEAGINLNKINGDKVIKNDLLFTLYSSKPINNDLNEKLKEGYEIVDKIKVENLILKKLS